MTFLTDLAAGLARLEIFLTGVDGAWGGTAMTPKDFVYWD
jgi:hypothetical protein